MPALINGEHTGDRAQRGARKSAAGRPPFRAASLFSGIGGFDVGFERAGFEITFQCEINKFWRSILKRNWPGIQACHRYVGGPGQMLFEAERRERYAELTAGWGLN
jgi:hypothetical protein